MPGPQVIRTTAADVSADPAVHALVDELRATSTACVFVCGGAGHMDAVHRDRVRTTLSAVARTHADGLRLVVGDGGTRAGVMELLGETRARAHDPFPLVGIVPAPEVPPRGHTPIDPHHSHIVAVDDPTWTGDSGWGLETPAMFTVFAALAARRPSVAIVANGGAIAIDEIARHVEARRPIILLAGSGRAADVLAHRLGHAGDGASAAGADPGTADLDAAIVRRGLLAHPRAFSIVHVTDGADGLHAALRTTIQKSAG